MACVQFQEEEMVGIGLRRERGSIYDSLPLNYLSFRTNKSLGLFIRSKKP